MKNSIKLNLPVWVVVAAVILAALIGWSLMSTSSMSYSGKGQMTPQATKAQMQFDRVLHAAVMLNNGLRNILSTDTHFDHIKGIRRLDPQALFAAAHS